MGNRGAAERPLPAGVSPLPAWGRAGAGGRRRPHVPHLVFQPPPFEPGVRCALSGKSAGAARAGAAAPPDRIPAPVSASVWAAVPLGNAGGGVVALPQGPPITSY